MSPNYNLKMAKMLNFYVTHVLPQFSLKKEEAHKHTVLCRLTMSYSKGFLRDLNILLLHIKRSLGNLGLGEYP